MELQTQHQFQTHYQMGKFGDLSRFFRSLQKENSVIIVCDKKVAAIYRDFWNLSLNQVPQLEIDAQEEHKNFASLEIILSFLATHQARRDTILVAIGGGVLTDLAAFAASIFKRGLRCVLVPTSLIGQVDAAIGGKTALNLAQGKNLVGSFFLPEIVFICPDFLETLPYGHFVSGYLEMIKMALITDAKWFAQFPTQLHSQFVLKNVEKAIQEKLYIVKKDWEDHHFRKVLNFGHTFGHALEMAFAPHLFHGFAVGSGMLLALSLSQQLLGFPSSEMEEARQRIVPLLGSLRVLTETETETVIHFMEQDKKNTGRETSMVLLENIGEPWADVQIMYKQIRELLQIFPVVPQMN